MKIFMAFSILFLCFSLYSQQKPAVAEAKKLDPVQAVKYLEKKEQELEKWTKVAAEKGSDLLTKKNNAMSEILNNIMDYDFIARFTIGLSFETASEAKKKELFNKLRELVTEFYLEEIFYNKGYEKKYIERGLEKMYIKGVDQSIAITTEIQVFIKKKPVVYEVVYHLYMPEKIKEYRVFDIELDGVSLIRNYKTQFQKTIKDGGVDELIKKIDKKIKTKNTK